MAFYAARPKKRRVNLRAARQFIDSMAAVEGNSKATGKRRRTMQAAPRRTIVSLSEMTYLTDFFYLTFLPRVHILLYKCNHLGTCLSFHLVLRLINAVFLNPVHFMIALLAQFILLIVLIWIAQ